MKILLVIPFECYESFLQSAPNRAYEYKDCLTNGVITEDPRCGKAVEIFCDQEQARSLLALALLVCPAAVPYIDESIRLVRTAP